MLKFLLFALTISVVFSTLTLTCPDGEYVDSSASPHKCKSCQKNCKKCTTATDCSECKDRYFFYSAGNTCELKSKITTAHCTQIADISASPTVCKTCEDGYWLKTTGKTCEAKTIEKCKVLTQNVDTEACTTWMDGWSKPSSTLLNCTKVHAQCIHCETETACTECASGYIKTDAGSCYQKTFDCDTWDTTVATEKCASCTSSIFSVHTTKKYCFANQCQNKKCSTAGKARSSYPFCDVDCHTGDHCVDCDNDQANQCLECDSGWQLIGKQCYNASAIIANCLELLTTSTCKACKDNTYGLTTDKSLCVLKTAQPHCTEMASANTCTTCAVGYYKKADNTCGSCKTNCICDVDDSGADDGAKCGGCQSGYKLDTGACVVCTGSNCKTCSTNLAECDSCESTHTKVGTACIENMANCNEMTDATHCATCAAHYHANSDATACATIEHCDTMQDATHCTTCAAPYFVNAAKTECVTIQHCATMQDETHCTTCSSPYFINAAKTVCELKAHCTTMSATDTCSDCDDGYYVASGSCTQCAANCKECTSTKCTQCNDGYYLDTTENDTGDVEAVCVECTETNARYQSKDCASEGKRTKFPWICEAFTGNCITNAPTPLIGEADQDCTACASGFKYDSTAKNCTACTPTNCHACENNIGNCTECKFGYYLNSDNGCTACDTSCSKCQTDSKGNSACMDCKDKKIYSADNTSKCDDCPANCDRCSSTTVCLFCSAGFFLKDGGCTACSTNCNDCEDATHCFGCNDGYYLDGASCKACLDNCKSCTVSDKCVTCKDGYTLNDAKTACTKSSTTTPSGNKCLTSVTGCMKCDTSDDTVCALCQGGSAPVGGKCSCETGKKLIAGACVAQEALPEDITKSSLADLSKYIDKSLESKDKKAENTKKVLARVKEIISATDGATNANAGTALQLLLQYSESATDADAQTSYKDTLTKACGASDLTQTNFEVAFAAADKFMKTASDPKAIYEAGFSTCLTNLLKKGTITDIPTMKLTNSEFQMRKFSKADGAKSLELTGVKVEANADFMAAVGTGDFYATIQAIDKAVNPYKNESTNTVELSSKIVSFSVMSSGSDAKKQKIELADNKTFPITFDAAGTGAKCGYYNETSKKWVQEGELDTKTCAFTHLTDFAIFKESTTSNNEETSAYLLQAFSILLIFIIAMF